MLLDPESPYLWPEEPGVKCHRVLSVLRALSTTCKTSTASRGLCDHHTESVNIRAMSSQPFLPLSSPPVSPRLLPRRPSLDPEREILSTRGQQRILTFLPSRASSTALQDLDEEASSPPTFLRRGSFLIGHSNPRYQWCVWHGCSLASASDQSTGNDTIDHRSP